MTRTPKNRRTISQTSGLSRRRLLQASGAAGMALAAPEVFGWTAAAQVAQ
jgi:uncharacterized protein (DUF1501 family)